MLVMKPLLKHLLRGASTVLALFPHKDGNGGPVAQVRHPRVTAGQNRGFLSTTEGRRRGRVVAIRDVGPPVAGRSDSMALRSDWQKVFGDLTKAFDRAREL
jgi:hypothetical protein